MQQYFAEYGFQPALVDDWAEFIAGDASPALAAARSPPASSGPRRTSRSSPRPSSTRASCGGRASARRDAATSTRCCATSPRCGSAIRSCTSSTASAATSAWRRSTSATAPNEFLHLLYANDAKLYVPVSSLHLISRYSGASPDAAPLHELGSGQWEKAKHKAAQQAHDTAAELLNLYAQRAARQGHAFTLDLHEYEAFAASFAFEETPDQAAAIEAVIARPDLRQADGPPGLRRRGLRQDRGRDARGVRRGRRRQAGRDARADDAARRAALPDVLRPLRRLAGASSPSCRASAPPPR